MTDPCTPLVFLDIDGVLNSHVWWSRRKSAGMPTRASYMSKDLWDLDPDACDVLGGWGEVFNIVISSTWRKNHSIEQISELFNMRGVTHPIVGMTPTIWPPPGIVRSKTQRGLEIQWWLRTYRADQLASGNQRIVILDDDSDMGDLLPWLVQTTTRLGLLQEHVEAASEKLRHPLGAPEWVYDALEFDAALH